MRKIHQSAANNVWDQTPGDDVFKSLTQEEAQVLRQQNPSITPWMVLAGQAAGGILLSFAAWWVSGKSATGWSVMYGAMAVVIPGALFARGLMSKVSAINPAAAVTGFFLWETVKIGLVLAMLFALRPAALVSMEAQPRAVLMGQVWRRFYTWVLVAIVVLFATGTHLYTATFRAARLATGNGSVPLGWHVMLVLGVTMMLVFGHIYFAGFKKYRRAIAAGQWPLAAKAGGLIHKMTLLNFALGWLAILAVRLVR